MGPHPELRDTRRRLDRILDRRVDRLESKVDALMTRMNMGLGALAVLVTLANIIVPVALRVLWPE